ncbi:unnamed protein product [Vicia faba]|uniref:Non-specific serine/threonine protein kinase n=1 Tax=Vicia faba TaxID=3906 RepID=A0AAV0ZIX4_VICFA|nr:unnamed protein product [Vicia faba]
MPSHKTFMIKKKLAKKMRQNRPIPYWIRMRTDNTIRRLKGGNSPHWTFVEVVVVESTKKLSTLSQFDDKPDYTFLKRLFRDLFIREGFQFDYVFDWTILKYQQSQIATPPSRAVGSGAGPSSGIPPAVVSAADRPTRGEEGRHTGWSSSDPARRRTSGPIANDVNLSRQKAPVPSDSTASKDAMLSSSNFFQHHQFTVTHLLLTNLIPLWHTSISSPSSLPLRLDSLLISGLCTHFKCVTSSPPQVP